MPHFFIDTTDERNFIRDTEGQEYEDLGAARIAAIEGLPDMARDELPNGNHRSFLALIRDELGQTVMVANLTLSVVSLTEDTNARG